jgi:Tol biopolymer transport system component
VISFRPVGFLRFGSERFAHVKGKRHHAARIAPLRRGLRRLSIFVVQILTLLGTTALFQPFASAQQHSVGTIVYTHAPDGSAPWPVTDIYSMGADGSNVKALTNDGHSHSPAWSPDGRRILFVHDSTLRTKPAYREQKGFESYHPVDLYVMDKDGSNRHLLRRLEPVIYSAGWSPDGKTLAITSIPEALANLPHPADEPVRAGLFLLPADGQGELRLLLRSAFTPSWSPDGKRLAFSAEQPRGLWAVHVANSDGSNDMQLTDPSHNGGSPAWSPDGKLIAFDEFVDQGRRQQIFIMDVNGTQVRQLTKDSNWSCGHPSWSPDGEQIAFSCRSASAPCGGAPPQGRFFRSVFVGFLPSRCAIQNLNRGSLTNTTVHLPHSHRFRRSRGSGSTANQQFQACGNPSRIDDACGI